MPRFVAFLRGVSPMNAKMPELKRSFEQAGFGNVRTLLSSGNVVFDARGSEATLVKKAEAAMEAGLGRTFRTQVRSVEYLQTLLDADPFAAFRLAKEAKRVVTFIPRLPTKPPALPIKKGDACILALRDRELLTVYVPTPGNPTFMALIEKTFGKDVTTRTWETVAKCASA